MLIPVLKYNFKLYMKSYKYIAPFFIFIIYMGLAYSIRAMDIVGQMMTSSFVVFALMAWIGFSYCNNETELNAEKILILKLKSHTLYWISNIIFMTAIGVFLSILATGIPLLLNCMVNIFKYPVTAGDIIIPFILHIFLSIIGALIGMLFQPRIISNRKMAVLGIIFVIVTSVSKEHIIMDLPYSRYIMWILPPIDAITNAYNNMNHFTISDLIIPLLFMLVYICAESFVLIKSMKKILF